ncbi:glycine receptor subunit beta-like [Homarus americanus]|uniref:glycine receptor subunit beta-like n=1 Tax=Homarus americanus TaxID=6706 RepID=UPI001C43F724|nr:glycine receptor subunit beta-like [Homarus americanus]
MTHEYRLLPVAWLKDIWRPDSFFKNAKAVTFQEMTIPNHYIWLYQDNTILYMVKLTLVLSCAMNSRCTRTTPGVPHEDRGLSHTTDDLVFIWDPEVPVEVERSIELPQLDLVKKYTGDCTQVYSTGNFTCLEVIFKLKRHLGHYLFHTYIPTCLIVIMSWISFWIRPEAVPARVTLGVTSLLTLSTQHANSQKSLPPVSYIKAIDVFMSSCTVFVFCSLMEYALVNVVLGDVPEDNNNIRIMRPRTLIQVPNPQDSPKKMSDFEDSPVRTKKTDTCQPITAPRRSATVQRRANGRKTICQSELETITTITSPVASPANGLSPLEMLAPASCPAHISTASHLTNSQVVNGPMFSGIQQHPGLQQMGIQHPGLQHTSVQHSSLQHTFGLPPPPPPPPLGPAKSPKNHSRRRERAILIDRVSRILFPTSFTVLNVIYWSVFVVQWF